MKTTLPKKSQEYQRTIDEITKIILEKGKDKIASLILFGSFARGDFVFDSSFKDNIHYSYVSDFDILIVVKKKDDSRHYSAIKFEEKIKKAITRNAVSFLERQCSVSFLTHSLEHVNKMLEENQYFFSDIKKEGILLYQDPKCELAEAKDFEPLEQKKIFQNHFDIWLPKGVGFLKGCKFYISENQLNLAAFSLHQATENLFNCALLVLTDYKPKTHRLNILNQMCSAQNTQFLKIFPKATKEQQECFDLLNSAYIDARYEPDFKITTQQLNYLIEKVENLNLVVEKVCLEKIGSFDDA